MIHTIVTRNAVLKAKELADETIRLVDSRNASAALTLAKLSELREVIEALPLDTTLESMVWFRNWVRTSQELWSVGEANAARYQLLAVRKKLERIAE